MKIALHLGLGDAIACAPIVAKYAQQEKVIISSYAHNMVSVKSFFAGLNVEVVDEKEFSIEKADIKLGYYRDNNKDKYSNFIEWLYAQAEMDLSERELYCPIRKMNFKYTRLYETPPNYIFVHHDVNRKFIVNENVFLNNSAIVPMYDDESIINNASILYFAKEIHCIDSAFLHLAEALPTTGQLFYHKYARPHSEDYTKTFIKNWKTIE